jgi:hypothetical protein
VVNISLLILNDMQLLNSLHIEYVTTSSIVNYIQVVGLFNFIVVKTFPNEKKMLPQLEICSTPWKK